MILLKMNATTYYHSPLGWIEIQATHDALTTLVFCDERKDDVHSGSAILVECVRQLDAYFAGRLKNFDLPVRFEGTEFQKKVWNVLMDIPFGKTVSYGDVAKMLHHPKAMRAVGAANGKNKIWIVVPCHRVIGANGSMTGYAGGIERKKWLINHESQLLHNYAAITRNPESKTFNLIT